MKTRTLPALILVAVLLLPLPALAESFSGSQVLTTGPDLNGTLYFTALSPGDTTSSFAPFAGYSQAASADYTYLYRLTNNSAVSGQNDGFGDYNNLTDLDLLTLVDPNGPYITNIGWASGKGEDPSAVDTTTAPNDIDYQFDDAPNFGITPSGSSSTILLFHSSLAPSYGGGAIITNNAPSPLSASSSSGVTTATPSAVPEPATLGLLAAGLAALARRKGK